MKDIIVEIKGLEKTYGKNEAETKAIQGIDLTITREEFVSIVGKDQLLERFKLKEQTYLI